MTRIPPAAEVLSRTRIAEGRGNLPPPSLRGLLTPQGHASPEKKSFAFNIFHWLAFDVIKGFNRKEAIVEQQLELPRVHGLCEPIRQHTLGRTFSP